jgi:hypothetical protein
MLLNDLAVSLAVAGGLVVGLVVLAFALGHTPWYCAIPPLYSAGDRLLPDGVDR